MWRVRGRKTQTAGKKGKYMKLINNLPISREIKDSYRDLVFQVYQVEMKECIDGHHKR